MDQSNLQGSMIDSASHQYDWKGVIWLIYSNKNDCITMPLHLLLYEIPNKGFIRFLSSKLLEAIQRLAFLSLFVVVEKEISFEEVGKLDTTFHLLTKAKV